ncbi:hypothetical protein SKUD_198404 [Saccharomyces kudriavzevii IFO 1802]|uniref:Uncharacterized protein n=1 Tax=Saccharomyces kudriavzevii (strain ATCC MYA-4449 / AS 2.2408 / CBS 8840 / NBRC 1802 / NCYC 2889) TaxID=226230 RepID=J4U364_SACK1|nr:hypothetical protein SKUD_198404 [Saccharomyces kudriavzevii IFO 1802]
MSYESSRRISPEEDIVRFKDGRSLKIEIFDGKNLPKCFDFNRKKKNTIARRNGEDFHVFISATSQKI